MARYFYYQMSGADAWIPGLAASRSQIVQDKQPRYATILDLNMNITHDSDRVDLEHLTYWGDLYIDIDVSQEMGGIDTAIVQMNTAVDKLISVGVKGDTLRLFASGSKGFHIEVPWQTFLDKEPKNGTPHLPVIMKEMVHSPELYCDGFDPRVYSCGRGRMWRSTNVKRENGKYKVQISLDECRSLTSEAYSEMVTGPRAVPYVAPPVYSPSLAVLYSTAHDVVVSRRKRIVKAKIDPVQQAKWAKKPPAELQRLLIGSGIKDGAGFHPIATQIALAAISLGWSVDEMLERAEGVVANHHGDGNRYDSPRKRQRELTRLWYYFSTGSGSYYEFSLGPIKSLLDFAAPPELDDQPEPGEVEDEDDEDLHDPLLTLGIKIRRSGIHKTVEGNEVRASAIGFGNVTQLFDVETSEATGYQADMYLDGRRMGERLMPMQLFSSRQAMQGFALANGGASLHLSDGQVIGLAELFRRKAMKADNRIFIVNREGLDFIRQPNGKVHAVYVSHEEFYCNHGDDAPRKYALKSVGRESQPIESDILHAPELSGSDIERKFLKVLLKINKPEAVAKMLGWFSASFVSQAIRLRFNQFPLLHVYGTAGAGKTKTVELVSNLHYYRAKPEIAAAAMLTSFAMKTRLASSASIPMIWDEVKFHEMNQNTKNNITQYLRNNYAAVKSETGTLRRDSGQSHVDLREYRNAAPLVFIGETMETESAIAERYVAVALTKQDRAGRQDYFDTCFEHREILGHVGKSLIQEGLNLDREVMAKAIKGYEKEVASAITGSSSDDSRRVFNYAVILYGLDFLSLALEDKFPGEFSEAVADLKKAMLASVRGDLPRNMSESSKVLDVMAFLTKSETEDQYRLVYGQDYTCSDDSVDLKLQNCYTKYLKYNRSIGFAPLFPDYGRFVAAMRKYPAMTDDVCLSNDSLKDTLRTDVYRFSAAGLDREGVEFFRGQEGTMKK